MTSDRGIVRGLWTASGKTYGLGRLAPGELQYMDREYRFEYIPGDLRGCLHVRTHGDDKLIGENVTCVSFFVTREADVFVLFADKFPVLPGWLSQYERTRLSVTRTDTRADDLTGYFGLYRHRVPSGPVVLGGCSPRTMLAHEWYVESGGMNYCMYTVAIVPTARAQNPTC
jgi:hypothetical protein